MADFPTTNFHRPVISCMSLEAVGVFNSRGFGGASAVWPSSNLALYVPFTVSSPYLVRKVWWANGSAVSGTTDVGIYTQAGALLTSSGATTQAGTSVIQSVTLASALLLTPGSYYMAMSVSTGATAQFFRIVQTALLLRFSGVGQQASAHALPATFTLATVANDFMPLFGIANATVI